MTAPVRVTGVLIALCWAWSAALAMAEPVTTIRSGGPSANRVDLVILGDGFTADQIASGAYAAQIELQVQRLFAQEPYLEYAAYFNVHRVDVVSAQSGADHPERGAYVDTALNASYNCSNIQRLICVSTANVNAVLTRSAIPADARDLVLVIVNDAEYGGSGGAVAVASLHAQATELVLHENGHTFAQLADEYNYSPPPCVTTEPTNANATRETRREFIKWRHWIDPGTPVPTGGAANGVPGLYDGAVYCVSGAYRPTYDSKMRSLGRPFEQINTEQHVRRIYNFVSPIDGVSPSTSAATVVLGVPNLFEVAIPSPRTHALLVRWFVNGVLTATGTRFSSDILPLGTHHVEVSIQDTTGLVRSDPTALLSESRAWDVTVQNGVTAVPTFLTASSIAGNTVTLNWTPPTAFAATGYVLEGGVSPGQVLASLSTGSAAPSFTFTAPTGAFYVRIHALNGAARSGASNEIRIYVNVPQPPGTPTNLLGGAAGSTLSLAWQNAGGGAPSGIVLDVSGSLSTSVTLPAAESFSYAGVPPGTYTFSVRAVNGAGTSLPSTAVTLTFPGTCTPPQTPVNLATARDGNRVTVTWNLPPGGSAPTGFVLSVAGSYTGSFPVSGRTLSAVAGSGTYELRVAATNSCGSSPASAPVTVTVP
ncbi:MAG TPA: M64 family metallopeptidase [Vicinamibacterales bacterium]|jgi:hypothetical protein|nr:M64 family metallopeptidase [Vicinamibacterales bacterium]